MCFKIKAMEIIETKRLKSRQWSGYSSFSMKELTKEFNAMRTCLVLISSNIRNGFLVMKKKNTNNRK